MISLLSKLSRLNKQLIMIVADSVLIVITLLSSFSVRLGYWYFPKNDLIWLLILGAPIIAIPVFYQFSLYRQVIRYIGFKALWTVVKAVSLYALIWGIVGFMIMAEFKDYVLPRSVILINWMISILVIGGVRLIDNIALN